MSVKTPFDYDDTSYGRSGGFTRPEIPKGRPPLNFVTKPGRILFMDNPRPDVPDISFRIVAHPDADETDFLREIGAAEAHSRGVTAAFAKPVNVAKVFLNQRHVWFRTDVRSIDKDGNAVNAQVMGRKDKQREMLPWEYLCERLNRILKNGAIALTKGIDVGVPIEWYRYLETTHFVQDGAKWGRAPIKDMNDAKLRDDFASDRRLLLMNGIMIIPIAQADIAEDDKHWPFLRGKGKDSGNNRWYSNIIFSPPPSAVKQMLTDVFTKKDKTEAISLENSVMGDIYTYENGARINVSRIAKDPTQPATGMNITYVVKPGLRLPLVPKEKYSGIYQVFSSNMPSKVDGTVTFINAKEMIIDLDTYDPEDADSQKTLSVDITGWEPAVVVGRHVSVGAPIAYRGVVSQQPYVEDLLEFVLKMFEDAEKERCGEGSKFIDENLSKLRSMFRAAMEESIYFQYLPERAQTAPDLLPEELSKDYRTLIVDDKGEEREGFFFEYLKKLPTVKVLGDKWLAELAAKRRTQAPTTKTRANCKPPPAPETDSPFRGDNENAPEPPPPDDDIPAFDSDGAAGYGDTPVETFENTDDYNPLMDGAGEDGVPLDEEIPEPPPPAVTAQPVVQKQTKPPSPAAMDPGAAKRGGPASAKVAMPPPPPPNE